MSAKDLSFVAGYLAGWPWLLNMVSENGVATVLHSTGSSSLPMMHWWKKLKRHPWFELKLKYLYFDLMFWNAKISKNPEWPDLFCRVPFGGSLWISSRINSFHGALCILIGCLVAIFCRYRLGRSPGWLIESPCVLFDLDFLEVTASEGY